MAISSSLPAPLARGGFETEARPDEPWQRLAGSRRPGTAPDLAEQVEAALDVSRGRITKLTSAGQAVWVKRPRRAPGYSLYGLHLAAAALFGICLFRPPRVSRGPSGLAAEARRLAHLRGKGWPVPRVLGITPRWLALSDNGPSLSDVVRELQVPERSRMLRAALQFLQTLHDAQGWHGAAQLRNLTCLQDGFGAIDFEDDVEPAMPLEVAPGARHLPVPDQRGALRRSRRDAGAAPAGRCPWACAGPRRGGAEHGRRQAGARPSACSDGLRHTSAATARPCRPSHVHSGDDKTLSISDARGRCYYSPYCDRMRGPSAMIEKPATTRSGH